MSVPADFHRITVRIEGAAWFVVVALDPREDSAGRVTFRRLSFTSDREQAGIWPACAVPRVLEILRRSYATAAAEPATFAEWIFAPLA